MTTQEEQIQDLSMEKAEVVLCAQDHYSAVVRSDKVIVRSLDHAPDPKGDGTSVEEDDEENFS